MYRYVNSTVDSINFVGQRGTAVSITVIDTAVQGALCQPRFAKTVQRIMDLNTISVNRCYA